MKKIYMLVFCTATLLSITNAQSNSDLQFQKGDRLLGGSIGYTVQRSTNNSSTPSTNPSFDNKYYSFNISPSFGYFTKPNQLTGFSLNFGYGSSGPANNDNVQKYYNYGAGYYKQYWNNMGKNFYFIIQGQIGGNYGTSKYIYLARKDESKTASAYFSIDPGFAYRIKKRLVLDVYYTNFLNTSFAYVENRTDNVLYSRNYFFGANTGLVNFSLNNFTFGFRYIL